jgi:hypothetical protein
VGRASRKRAEQRRSAGERPPPPELSERPARRPPFRHPPADADGGLFRLHELRQARAELEDTVVSEVAVLVALGTDWGSIGRALGVSRQTARQRYGNNRPQ